jgi:hypothetical protein
VIAIDSCSSLNRSAPSATHITIHNKLSTYGCVPLVNLEWTKYSELPQNVDEYRIWKSSDGVNFSQITTVSATDTTFTDSAVSLNQTYCYRIQAFDLQSNYFSYSDSFCIEPLLYPLPLAAEMNFATVTFTSPSNGSIFMDWKKALASDTVARGYRVYHSTNGGSYNLIHTTNNLNDTSFIHNGIDTESGLNFYFVTIYNKCGEEGDSSLIHRPVQLSVQNQNLQTVLNWSNYLGFNVNNYIILRSENGSGYYNLITLPPNGNSFTDTLIRCNVQYSYKILADNGTGIISESDTLALIGFDTIPPVSANMHYATVFTTDQQFGQVNLQFRGASDKNRKGYVVFRSDDGVNFSAIDTILSTSLNNIAYLDVNEDTENKTFSYYISSFDSCGNFAVPVDTHRIIHLNVQAVSKANILNWSHYKGFGNWSYQIERKTPFTNWITINIEPETINSYSDSATMCDTLYSYRITATEFGTFYASESNVMSVIAFETEAPDEPELVRVTVNATGVTNGEVTLDWIASPSTDVEGYNIFRSEDGINWTLAQALFSGTTFTDNGLNTLNKSYFYRVQSEDTCGNVSIAFSAEHKTILMEALRGNERITLNWTDYGGWTVDEYRIFRDGNQVATVPTTVLTFTDTNVIACTQTYEYWIQAVSQVDTTIISLSNRDTATPFDLNAPKAVYMKFASVSNPNNQVHLQWEKSVNIDAAFYRLYRRIPGERRYSVIYTTSSPNQLEYFDSVGITSGLCYYVAVVDYCGNESEASNFGCPIVLSGKDGQLFNDVYWNAYHEWSQDVQNYVIYKSEDNGTWTEIGNVTGSNITFRDDILTDEVKDYCYQVKAVEKGGSLSQAFSTVLCLNQEPVIYIPNAFTPDKSFGINDGFAPGGMHIASFEMEIYDRWGGKVYETNDSKPWDGKGRNGAFVNEGVFIYHITIYSYNGNIYKAKGTVTVLR